VILAGLRILFIICAAFALCFGAAWLLLGGNKS
jgi:hypothetical protein